jgi:hypothetical protein
MRSFDTLHYLVSTNQIIQLQFPLNAPILTNPSYMIYISPFLKAYHSLLRSFLQASSARYEIEDGKEQISRTLLIAHTPILSLSHSMTWLLKLSLDLGWITIKFWSNSDFKSQAKPRSMGVEVFVALPFKN